MKSTFGFLNESDNSEFHSVTVKVKPKSVFVS